MNVKETKTRVIDWCNKHEDVIFYAGCVVTGALIGASFGKAMGNVIANGYDRTYSKAIQDGYDQGRLDAIALLLKDNRDPEIIAALANHMGDYYKVK